MLESQDRTKVWFITALCLLLLIAGYFFAAWLFPATEPLHPTASEEFPVAPIAPVVAPTIEDVSDIAQYTEEKPLPTSPGPTVFLRQEEGGDRLLRGSAQAPVTLIAYTNFSGTYGRVLHTVLQQLFAANGTAMNWVFRHYPATDNALDLVAAQGVECVDRQLGEDTAWRYIDQLYKQEKLTESLVYSVAAQVGADEATLRACIEGKKTYDTVLQQKFHAQADTKIFVIPSVIFVKNKSGEMRVVEGLNTLEYLQAVLEDVAQ